MPGVLDILVWWLVLSAVVGTAIGALQEQEPPMASAPVRSAFWTLWLFMLPLLVPLVCVGAAFIDRTEDP